MFTFADYKKLKTEVRTIATRYWAEVVMRRLGVTKPNQILAKHLGDAITSTPGWSNNSSRFWNRMCKGAALLKENNANKTDALLPGTKAIFTHPLWQLLDHDRFDYAFNNMVLLALAPEIRDRLFKANSDGCLERKSRVSTKTAQLFFSLNSLDGLTCLLALSLEARSEASPAKQLRYEMGAMNIFLRLATLTEIKVVAEPIYKLMSNLFNQSPHDIKRITALDMSLPIPTKIVPEQFPVIQRAIRYYETVLMLATDKGLLRVDRREKEIFLSQVTHLNVADLLVALVSIGQTPEQESYECIQLSKVMDKVSKFRK
jgi:hypothetical protein